MGSQNQIVRVLLSREDLLNVRHIAKKRGLSLSAYFRLLHLDEFERTYRTVVPKRVRK